MNEIKLIFKRIGRCIKRALPKALNTSFWLIKIIVPIALAVRLLQYYGVLDKISEYLKPIFGAIGLPGETAIVFITSLFSPLYAPIALISSLDLNIREASILAIMCLISHNLPVESAVQSHTGSSFWNMTFIRVMMSFIVALALNAVLPLDNWGKLSGASTAAVCESVQEVIWLWLSSSFHLIITIALIVTLLMILHYVMEEFHLMERLSDFLSPLMKVFGLPKETAFLWLVGNVVGLAYGGAIMRDQVDQGKLSPEQGNLLNHHLAVSHSLLEDTIIFAVMGIPALLIIGVRLVFAMLVVWSKRGYDYLYTRKLKHLYE